jgi:basic membrane lipoprotein Med (substrate-binding protein (PBP1-ABC) superfamily)
MTDMNVNTKSRRTPEPTRALPRKRAIILGALAAVIVAIGATWLLWPSSPPPPPRARQYLAFTACLLTGPQGIQAADAAPVWAGMQQASLATRAKVQYLSVTDPQTTENASAFLASLTQSRCNLVFATGDKPTAATRNDAAKYPSMAFYVISSGADTKNLTYIDSTAATDIQQRVRVIITKAVNANPH